MSFASDNERFLKILSAYLNLYEKIVDEKAVKAVAKTGVGEERAFCYVLAESLGVDTVKERGFFENYFIPSVKKLDVCDYYSDPYYKYVSFSERSLGDMTLKYMTCAPYQGFVRDDFSYFPDGRVVPMIGFFDQQYRYPAVLQGGREWMTLLPNEINSQKRYVDEAFGKVLTYGLGLGYYVLMTAIKDNVDKVTVVDIDKNVIELFKNNILPQFPPEAAKKVSVVCADALSFGKTLKTGDHDYIYADIWHDAGDGVELYKKLKENEKYCPTAKYGYWIEQTMKYYM